MFFVRFNFSQNNLTKFAQLPFLLHTCRGSEQQPTTRSYAHALCVPSDLLLDLSGLQNSLTFLWERQGMQLSDGTGEEKGIT